MTKEKTCAELVKYLVEQLAGWGAEKFRDLDNQILKDHDLMAAALQREPAIFEYIDESLRGDLKFAQMAIAKKGYLIQHASDDLKANESVAFAAVSQSPFSLRFCAKELWSNEGLLNIAFGKYKKPSPDSCDTLKEFVYKLIAYEIDQLSQGETKEEFANFVSAYCLSVQEYKTDKNKITRRMFFTIAFQAEPINLIINQSKNARGVWITEKSFFRDEDGNTDIDHNGRINELLGDLDSIEEDVDDD